MSIIFSIQIASQEGGVAKGDLSLVNNIIQNFLHSFWNLCTKLGQLIFFIKETNYVLRLIKNFKLLFLSIFNTVLELFLEYF